MVSFILRLKEEISGFHVLLMSNYFNIGLKGKLNIFYSILSIIPGIPGIPVIEVFEQIISTDIFSLC